MTFPKRVNCILLVDDNEADNFYTSYIIKDVRACNQIRTAQSGMEALGYISKTKCLGEKEGYPVPDLIFLDINMPQMDGFEFIDELKKRDHNLLGTLKIIMLTSSTDPIEAEKALRTGVIKEFINKPLETAVLINLLERYCLETA